MFNSYFLFVYQRLPEYPSSTVPGATTPSSTTTNSNMTLLLMSSYISAYQEYDKKTNYLVFSDAYFLRLYCLNFSFKLADICRSYDNILYLVWPHHERISSGRPADVARRASQVKCDPRRSPSSFVVPCQVSL